MNKVFLNKQQLYSKKWLFLTIMFIVYLLFFFLISFVDERGFNVEIFDIQKYALLNILLLGICLGTSSYLIQHLSNNRLADTSILGIGNINSFLITIMALLLNLADQNSINLYNTMIPFVFISGSILISIILFSISGKNKISKKFIIIGIFINFFISAVSSLISSWLPSGKSALISPYLNGFITDTKNDYYLFSSIVIIVLILWFLLIANKFRIVSLDPYIASELGINVLSVSRQIIIISGALAGVAYIIGGNISFMGIIAGNIATSIFKKQIKSGMLAASISSMAIMSIAFFIFVNLIPGLTNYKFPVINPANVISFICIPYFLYLIFSKN